MALSDLVDGKATMSETRDAQFEETSKDPAYDEPDPGETGQAGGSGEGEPEPEPKSGDTIGEPAEALKSGLEQPKKGAKEGKPAPDKKGFVPYSRFEEVIRQNQEMRDRIAKNEGRFEAFTQALTKKPEPPPPTPPDKDIDPQAYQEWQNQQVQQQVQTIAQQQAQTQQREFVNDVRQRWQATAAAYSNEKPDFFDAYNHAIGVHGNRLKLQFPQATPQQIQDELVREELVLVHGAMQRGENPADVVYRLAQTYGYQPPPPPEAGNNGDPPQRPGPAATTLAATAQRQASNRSVAAAGGPTRDLTTVDVDDMSDDEFANYVTTQKRRLNPLRA